MSVHPAAGMSEWRFCIAPMMDRTDRHERYFLRQISSSVRLYSEMITTGALLHGDRDRFLAFDPAEAPVALQLGGAIPDDLARCAAMAEARGFDEVNLNVGCPSNRVQRGQFGVCLMKEPDLVAACVRSMRRAVGVPVTVKTRIGVDSMDSWDFFCRFVDRVAETGCRTFIIHARKAWLKGLSPRENREVPPLRYEQVYRLKETFPELTVVVNGGITATEQARVHLAHVDGVMIGRAVYENPWLLAEFETELLGGAAAGSRHTALERYLAYMDRELARGTPLPAMTRHILGLFRGLPGARSWRRYLCEHMRCDGAGSDAIREAAELVRIPNEHISGT